ncbi:uncharacterized protein isoform X3 [Rhodnius prolixus]
MAPERGEGPGEETGVAPAQDPVSPHNMLHIKEGDGAVEPPTVGRAEDDDLTSLSWLQDKNLLKDINLRTNTGGTTGTVMGSKQESPTSDYAEECASEQSESTCSSVASCSPVPAATSLAGHIQANIGGGGPSATSPSKNKHPHHIPYDPQVHITSKPPYSFSCLIFMSIEDSKGKALPVKEIYTWILDHFPYYRNAPTGWKNSVRHNLSLNKCFKKVDKAPNLGKGSLWMVDPVSRPKLVEALMKAPYHPYTNLDKNNSAPHLRRRSPSPAGPTREPNGPEGSTCQDEELDDVDAAAAMLVLKHGPHARLHISSHTREEYQKRMSLQGNSNGYRHRDEESSLITRSSDDHTYSSLESGLEHISADEAFADGSDSNSSCSLRIFEDPELEERRKTAEGADALLNLAGIKTSGGQRLVTETPLSSRVGNHPPLVKRSRLISSSNYTNNNNNCINNNNTHHTMVPAKLRRKAACPQKVRCKRLQFNLGLQ